jgi:hypothetical protein
MDITEQDALPESYHPFPEGFAEVKLEHSPVILMAHGPDRCKGEKCALHNRSSHGMRAFMQHWRSDRQLMERICPHGVGHPDPDQWDYLVKKYGKRHASAEFVHGCCWERCCRTVNDSQLVTAE